MNTAAHTAHLDTAAITTHRDAVRSTTRSRSIGIGDRLLMRLGLAMMIAGHDHAANAGVGREPRAAFGPHRGAEVLRPFC